MVSAPGEQTKSPNLKLIEGIAGNVKSGEVFIPHRLARRKCEALDPKTETGSSWLSYSRQIFFLLNVQEGLSNYTDSAF